MRERFQYLLLFAIISVAAFFCGSLIGTSPLQANTAPNYGIMPFEVAFFSSTVDGDILAAPGTDKRWVVSGIAWNVLVEEADATVVVQDKAGTAQHVLEFAPETQGWGSYIDFEQGVKCHQNSGVEVDLSGQTADVWVMVTAYIERME